jgi:hypothetical protein
MKNKDLAWSVAIGAGAGAVFLFAFPGGAITTLMHEVAGLPGPGAGIALVLGPSAVFVSALCMRLFKRDFLAVPCSLFFGAAFTVARIIGIEGEAKGDFGGPVFLAGMLLTGIVLAAVARALARRGYVRDLLAGVAANGILLGYYWTAIFPRTAKWVACKDVPVLLALALGAGLVAGWAGGACGGIRRRSRPDGDRG